MSRVDRSAKDEGTAEAPKPLPVLSSRDLFAGGREVIIAHGSERYRLRLTSSNKLILVK